MLLILLLACDPKFQAWIDSDGDGYGSTEDCDDGQASVNPGMEEDCDEVIDEVDSGAPCTEDSGA